jgi:hypothetical protein
MTLDELVKMYNDAAAHEYEVFLERGGFGASTLDVGLDMKRAGIRAVVEALRDEIFDARGNTYYGSLAMFCLINEILASDGEVKAAGGPARKDGKAVEAVGDKGPATVNSPAADPVCPDCHGKKYKTVFGGSQTYYVHCFCKSEAAR